MDAEHMSSVGGPMHTNSADGSGFRPGKQDRDQANSKRDELAEHPSVQLNNIIDDPIFMGAAHCL